MKTLPSRIVQKPGLLGGKPVIRGMRISVHQVLAMLAEGWSWEKIKSEYPVLEDDDIQACVAYANSLVEDVYVVLPSQQYSHAPTQSSVFA